MHFAARRKKPSQREGCSSITSNISFPLNSYNSLKFIIPKYIYHRHTRKSKYAISFSNPNNPLKVFSSILVKIPERNDTKYSTYLENYNINQLSIQSSKDITRLDYITNKLIRKMGDPRDLIDYCIDNISLNICQRLIYQKYSFWVIIQEQAKIFNIVESLRFKFIGMPTLREDPFLWDFNILKDIEIDQDMKKFEKHFCKSIKAQYYTIYNQLQTNYFQIYYNQLTRKMKNILKDLEIGDISCEEIKDRFENLNYIVNEFSKDVINSNNSIVKYPDQDDEWVTMALKKPGVGFKVKSDILASIKKFKIRMSPSVYHK
jgi:hypothetical protein